jgi:hypothetical protein
MANEINLQFTGQLNNGGLVDSIAENDQITQSVAGKFDRVFDITTSDAALTISITTLGYARFTNLDATNYVKIGPESGGALIPFGKLKPGETGVIRLMTGITVRAQADTATCKVRVQVWND